MKKFRIRYLWLTEGKTYHKAGLTEEEEFISPRIFSREERVYQRKTIL